MQCILCDFELSGLKMIFCFPKNSYFKQYVENWAVQFYLYQIRVVQLNCLRGRHCTVCSVLKLRAQVSRPLLHIVHLSGTFHMHYLLLCRLSKFCNYSNLASNLFIWFCRCILGGCKYCPVEGNLLMQWILTGYLIPEEII